MSNIMPANNAVVVSSTIEQIRCMNDLCTNYLCDAYN